MAIATVELESCECWRVALRGHWRAGGLPWRVKHSVKSKSKKKRSTNWMGAREAGRYWTWPCLAASASPPVRRVLHWLAGLVTLQMWLCSGSPEVFLLVSWTMALDLRSLSLPLLPPEGLPPAFLSPVSAKWWMSRPRWTGPSTPAWRCVGPSWGWGVVVLLLLVLAAQATHTCRIWVRAVQFWNVWQS